MKTLEKSQEKIQKICDKIRHETIEPAKQEAEMIIQAAQQRAEEVIAEGKQEAERLLQQARMQIERERTVVHSSLQQAAKQVMEYLRQSIEEKLLDKELGRLIEIPLGNPHLIADLISVLVKKIDEEGMSTDIAAIIPHTVRAEEILALLADNIRKKLRDQPLEIGTFAGGVQIKLQDKNIRLDFTEKVLHELIAQYVRKDFRHYLFGR